MSSHVMFQTNSRSWMHMNLTDFDKIYEDSNMTIWVDPHDCQTIVRHPDGHLTLTWENETYQGRFEE